jgi:hypothetical protein
LLEQKGHEPNERWSPKRDEEEQAYAEDLALSIRMDTFIHGRSLSSPRALLYGLLKRLPLRIAGFDADATDGRH